jgi:hypothetical protein
MVFATGIVGKREDKGVDSMTSDRESSRHARRDNSGAPANGVTSGAYGLGFIGAAVYYIQGATSFLDGFIGFLKALVWPAFVVYELMKFLKM